ncbi:hypothetical protein JXA63_03255 [Candidatus Woesebacteria bacterium]|nr:hypothetical protein [Candidatus Woesebacteria bacterium]
MNKYLYHASPVNVLKEIEPRAKTIPENFDKGPCIFATEYFDFATQFLVPHDDSWANGGAFSDQTFFVISDRKRFEKADKGGSIYLVKADDFQNYNRREWFSIKKVKTFGEVKFSSGLMAMITQGVQVYFVDESTYINIQNAQDHGLSILNSLETENEKWGFTVKKLDMYQGSKKKLG